MPDSSTYENEISKLNNQVEILRRQLQEQQLQANNYAQSLESARRYSANTPSPQDINPILRQIREKNLSARERRDLIMPELFPSLPEDIYYQWVASTRLVRKRDREWYWTMGLVLMILMLFSVILREYVWIAVILAFFFAYFVNLSIPAADTVYKLTRQGLEIGEGSEIEVYAWQQMLDYSFFYKMKNEVLYIDTLTGLPSRIQILFSQDDRKNISMILEAHLPYKKVPKKQNWFEKIANGVYIPLPDFKALQEKIDKFYDEKYAEILQELKQQGRIPQTVTVADVRSAESIETMKLIDQMRNTEDQQLKQILGL